MNREEVEIFARQWADAWNNRDVEKVLEHFHEDVIFTSPTALAVVGRPTVNGKAALRAYWVKALNRIETIRFSIERLVWDPQRGELAIIYMSEINGKSKKVSENLIFNQNGLVVTAEVFHGIS
jgi:ketosteroid isomerase-like protein